MYSFLSFFFYFLFFFIRKLEWEETLDQKQLTNINRLVFFLRVCLVERIENGGMIENI